MRPAASVLAVTLLLVMPTFIAGSASAEWTQLHRFAGVLGRDLLSWDLDDNGTLYFATEHERQFLLFERGEGFALNSTYLRPSANLHRVAVVELNGTWGVLYQERVTSHDASDGERAPLVFTWPHNVTEAASRVVRSGHGGGFLPHWSVSNAPDPYPLGPTHQARQDPEDGRVHFLRVVEGGWIRVSSLNASTLTFNASGDEDLVLDPLPREDQARVWTDNVSDWRLGQGEVRLLPNGSVFAVRWNENGAFATRWNVTGAEVEERLSPYWDYQSARLSWTSNGTYAVMMGQRRDVCDLFVRWPGGEWNQSVVEKCPLVDHDYGLQDFEVREDGSLRGLTSRGFWTGTTRVEPLPCIPNAGFWDRRMDGREFLRGPGPSVWMRAAVPNVTVTTDPAGEVPTGLGVQFRLEGNLSHLTDPQVVWHFEGRRAVGESVSHAFLAPGEQTVTVVVESGLEGCRTPAVRESLTFTATGVDRSTPEPTADNGTDDNATDANTTGKFMGMPAPGAPVALLAALGGAAFGGARRRRGA